MHDSNQVYVTGSTSGSLESSDESSGEGFVIKYNADGKKIWIRQFETSNGNGKKAIAVDRLGNSYITGTTGDPDGFLIKYNTKGTNQWTRQFGTNSDDFSNDIAVDYNSSRVYVTGNTDGGLNGNPPAEFNIDDGFVIEYNKDGTELWTKQFGTSEFEFSHSICVSYSGRVYVTGMTEGELDGNTSARGRDVFIAQICGNSR